MNRTEKQDDCVRFQGLIMGLSTRFIHLEPDSVDGAIERALGEIGEYAGVDRSYLFVFHDNRTRLTNTHEWCAPGIEPAIQQLENLPADAFPLVTGRILANEILHIPDVTELPPEAEAERKEFEAEGIQSLVLVPLVASGRVIGFVGFDSVREKKTWPDEAIGLLRIVGDMLSNALERKRSAEALRRSEERFRHLIDNSDDFMALHDRDGRYLYYAGPNRYGVDPETVVGKTPLDLLPPEEAVEVLKQIRRVADDGEPVTVENRLSIGDERLWFSEFITPVRDEKGALAGVARFCRNITARKRAEGALRESEAHFLSLMESARGFVVYRLVIDRSVPFGRRVLFASPSIRELLWIEDPLNFGSWFENLHEEERGRIERASREAGDLGEPFSEEMRFRDPNTGETRWIRAEAGPIKDGGGNVTSYNGFMLDVTGPKLAEEELRSHRLRLEEIVAERTAKLSETNELLMAEVLERKEAERKIKKLNEGLEVRVARRTAELEKANQELRRVGRMKDTFLSTVSHELRTPLTSIRSFSEYLMSYDEDRDTQKEFAEIINLESERLTRLINDVLDLSKIEAGGMTWNDAPCSLAEITEGVGKSQLQVLEKKSIRFQTEFEEEFPAVRVDRDRIHQVLTNLVGNAIKFSPEGSAIVVRGAKVSGKRAGDKGDWVRVSVEDQGEGVPEKDIEAIFEKFRQASGPRNPDAPKGTGLGLPICREIVSHYGGDIWAESMPGRGSTFHFTLPATPLPARRSLDGPVKNAVPRALPDPTTPETPPVPS